MEKIYTVNQVAKLLQVSVITIRRYLKAGKLAGSKIGKDYRILENDVLDFLQRMKIKK